MRHPSSLIWFRWAASDLHPWEILSLRWHTFRCAACAARWTKERAQLAVAPEIPPLPGLTLAPARRWVPWLTTGLTTLAVALVAVVLIQIPGGSEDDLHPKGGSRFDLFVAGSPPRILGSQCKVGETVQPVVETHRRFLIVMGVDPRGMVSVLFPARGDQSVPAPSGQQRLPQSWTFDAAPGEERFIALFSDAPIDAKEAARLATASTAVPEVERIERRCAKAGSTGGTQ